MLKILKFVLFLVLIAFAFALGVKFSYFFNEKGLFKDEKLKIQEEMNNIFSDDKSSENKTLEDGVIDSIPLTMEEKNDVNYINNSDPNYITLDAVEVVEDPMNPTNIQNNNGVNPGMQPNIAPTNFAPANTNNAPAPVAPTPVPVNNVIAPVISGSQVVAPAVNNKNNVRQQAPVVKK